MWMSVTGLTRAERWPQQRAAAWTEAATAARAGWDQIVIDCGFGLEEDEEPSFDIPALTAQCYNCDSCSHSQHRYSRGDRHPVGFVRFMKE